MQRESEIAEGNLEPVEWKDAVLDLANQVEGWVSDSITGKGGMPLHVVDMSPEPDQPLLEMEVAGQSLIRLEPARFAANRLPTVVNLYAYPTLRRVRLVGPTSGAWQVQSSQGVDMKYGWNRDDFIRLLTELADESVSRSV
jgi:hypothetical protein